MRLDYTSQARSFAFKYPLFTHVAIQVNFWVIAYLLLVTIMHFMAESMIATHALGIETHFTPAFFSAIAIGIQYGVMVGIVDYFLERRVSRRLSLGGVILIRSLIYVLVLLLMMAVLRYVIWDMIVIGRFYDETVFHFTDDTWFYIFMMFALYTVILAPGISFINQVNKKFGPGVLLPMLFGQYKNPREQDRLFMLLDLKSSTTIAESLGHKKYSTMIQECFLDINEVIYEYNAEIYQYVGDEIVLSWLKTSKEEERQALEFFFAVQQKFRDRDAYYQETFSVVPEFKAGLHRGVVVAVEVGDIKREIAYHGDTINTAARIQGECNTYKSKLLISKEIQLNLDESMFNIEEVGEIALRGKLEKTKIYNVMAS